MRERMYIGHILHRERHRDTETDRQRESMKLYIGHILSIHFGAYSLSSYKCTVVLFVSQLVLMTCKLLSHLNAYARLTRLVD